MILQITLNGLTMSSTYILIALGFSLIFGMAGIFNFAHGALFMSGGFAVVVLFGQLGLNYGVAMVLTMIIVGLLGVGFDRFLFRRVRGQMMPSIIVALGLSLLIPACAELIFGVADWSVPGALTGVIEIWGATISGERVSIIGISGLLFLGLHFFTRRTKLGQAMRAVAQDDEVAALQGVNIDLINHIAFGLGAALAAAAGGLIAPLFRVNPFVGDWAMFKAIIVVILGGLGSIRGAVLAGFMLGLAESFSYAYGGGVLSDSIGFAIAILVLLLRPQGLFGVETR